MASRGYYAPQQRESLSKHSDVLGPKAFFPQRGGMLPTCVAAATILLLIAGSSVTLVSATDSAKQKMATKSNPAASLGSNNVHHHDYEETAKLKTCRKSKASSGPSITTTSTRRRADENCAVCDAFAEELERAIRYATSTDPLAMQSYLVRLLQRYVMFWHPHYFLRRIVKAVYFILSGAPNEALRTVRESAELIEFDLHLSFGQGIRSNEENDFASNLGVEHEVPRGVIERAKGFLYQNEGSLTSTGVAFAKWDAGVAFTVDEVLADEERGNGFPWVIAREGSSGGGGGAKKMAGGRSRNKYLGVVDHQVYDPTHFSGAAAGRQVIPLGAAAFTALALQEESSRDLEKDLLPGNKKRDTKENNNKKHATTAQSVVDDDDHVIITGDDEDGKGDRPHDGNEDIYEDEDNDADVYAFHFAEVQPELCIAYNNTASYYTFEEGEGEKADEGERKGNDKGALVLVERSFLSALDPSLGVVDGLDTDTSAPAVDSSSFSSSSTTEKRAAMAMRRDMNFGYAGRRLPPPLLPSAAAAAAPTYRHHQTATTEIEERGKRGGSGEEGRTLTHIDPLVASSLAEMYPLGFVWVAENSDAHGVPLHSKDIVGEGFVDDWGDLQDEKAPQSSFVRSFFNTVFSWIFSPSTIFGSHNNDLTNKNEEPFVALLKSPPSRAQLGRCFVPIPTKKGMSRALALLKKAESERGIKRNGDQSSSSSPSSPSQIPSQHQQQHTLFSSVPDDVSSLALAIASVSRSVTFEYVDAARHLLAVTSPSSSSVSLSLPPSLEEYSPLALITIASNLSPSYLDEKESKKEDYAESQPNSPRPSDVLFAHQRKSSARQLQAVAMTIAAAQRPQRLALSTSLTSPTALILALEQIAKADALVATSRELISVNLQQGAASVALGASEGSQGSHRGGEEKRDDSSGKNTLFTDEAMESRGLVSWMMSLASSIVSPPTPPSLIGVFSSRASEASLALVLALPREVFAMSMCPKKSQLFYSATSTHQQRDQQKASSSASVTVTAENSAAVATARTRASSVADSLVVRPSDVAFFTHASIPHSSDSEHHESKRIEQAKVTINEEGQGEHGQPSLPTRGGADDVLDTKKKQQRYSPCAFTDAGVGVSADDIAFSYWFTTIAAKAEKAATATEGSQDGLLATSTHINRALVVDSRVAASAPLSRSSEDGSKKGAAGSFALWKGRHINDGLQKKMHEVAAALVCAGTCARSSCQASSALEAHFKAFFEVYFGHSVALFNELAEGAADHYLQAGQVSQAPGFVEANTIKHQDDGDTKGKTENSDESGAAKKKSENHPPRKAVRRAILRAAVKKMKKKSGREVQKTYQKKKGCGKKQGDLHAEL